METLLSVNGMRYTAFMEKHFVATSNQMRKLDDAAIAAGLEVRQMMELAGYHMAQYCIERFEGKRVGVFAGSGNNGGDVIAASRFLHNAGFDVEVILLTTEEELKPDGKHHLALCKRMGIAVLPYKSEKKYDYDLILDGLIGYSLHGNPEADFKKCIEMFHQSKSIIISTDVPSGYDANSGAPLEPCVHADATLFLAYPKLGYDEPKHRQYFGDCYLIDLGIPRILYKEVGLVYPF